MSSPETLTSFLAARGGRMTDGMIVDFGNYAAECKAFEHSACVADAGDWGLLRIHGADAATFLHNQLSTNVQALPPDRLQRSTYNSPKGRMLANGYLWRMPDTTPTFSFMLAADLVTMLKKRLSMFVLRAKVTIDDVTPEFALLGLCGAGALVPARRHFSLENGENVRRVVTRDGISCAVLSARRLVLALPHSTLPSLWSILAAEAVPAGRRLWQRAAILEGVPLVTAATSEKLIPQAANEDALDALDFQKGCYPGQEIVARTRYLGRTKERLYLAQCYGEQEILPATPLYSPLFGEQACGMVVNSAPDQPADGPRQLLLASLQTAAAGEPLHVSRPDGPTLTLLPLPYELPVPETPHRIKL